MGRGSSNTVRHYRDGDEYGIVDVLNRVFPNPWGTVEDWEWKHRRAEGFNPKCVLVAEWDGRIVGCWHATVREVVIGHRRLKVGFEGDAAVLPSHRGGGLALRLYDALNDALLHCGVVLRTGVATPELARDFYAQLFGYYRLPAPVYTKSLSNRPLKEAIAELGERMQRRNAIPRDLAITIEFLLTDMPRFVLKVSGGVVSTMEELIESDVSIAGNQGAVLSALRGRSRGGNPWRLPMALLFRQVRLRGWLFNGFKLARLVAVMVSLRREDHRWRPGAG